MYYVLYHFYFHYSHLVTARLTLALLRHPRYPRLVRERQQNCTKQGYLKDALFSGVTMQQTNNAYNANLLQPLESD